MGDEERRRQECERTVSELSETDRRLTKAMTADPFVAYNERLELMRTLQRTQLPCFCVTDFLILMQKISQDFHSEVIFTHEAADAIQQMTEEYVRTLIGEANTCAHHAGRFVVTGQDLRLASHIRGGKL